MKNGRHLRPILLLLFYPFAMHLFGALPADSVKPKKPSTQNDTWFYASEPEQHHTIDSSIFHFEEYNIIQREGREYMNVGNTGSAAYPLIFDNVRTVGFNAGYNQFDLYKYKLDSVKYYQVIRPYTELSMAFGLHNEQVFHGRFANQHKNMFYYGVDFTRVFSKGIYTNQRTNDNGFSLYGIYNSKNKRLNVKADLIFNSFKVQENGGVAVDPFDSVVFRKSLVPVNLTTPENIYKQIDFYLTTSYNVGKKYLQHKNDTLRVPVLLPVFKISHRFNIERSDYKYVDYPADSLYYLTFYGNQLDFSRNDSVSNRLTYFKIGNSVMLEYRPRKLTSDSTYVEKDFIAYAEAGFDYFLMNQNKFKSNFGDLYVAGTFRNNYASKANIIYRGSVKYYLYGYNQNDFIADAIVGYNFGKYGVFTGNFTYQLNEAPYIYEHYNDSAIAWSYKLPKTKVMDIGGKYQNPRYGIIADLNYYVADHLPVYPGLSSPYVNTKIENVIVAHIGNRNQVVGLHFDNDVWFSAIANDGLIKQTYPMLVTKHSIYYERRIFKKALWLDFGFDLRYRLKNNAPYYDPLLGTFYPTGQSLRSFPVLDFFVNVKVKTVRVFLKLNNISSSFGPKGYYAAYGYPATDFTFVAGLSWRFFE